MREGISPFLQAASRATCLDKARHIRRVRGRSDSGSGCSATLGSGSRSPFRSRYRSCIPAHRKNPKSRTSFRPGRDSRRSPAIAPAARRRRPGAGRRYRRQPGRCAVRWSRTRTASTWYRPDSRDESPGAAGRPPHPAHNRRSGRRTSSRPRRTQVRRSSRSHPRTRCLPARSTACLLVDRRRRGRCSRRRRPRNSSRPSSRTAAGLERGRRSHRSGRSLHRKTRSLHSNRNCPRRERRCLCSNACVPRTR
jgi:hypothetical protein